MKPSRVDHEHHFVNTSIRPIPVTPPPLPPGLRGHDLSCATPSPGARGHSEGSHPVPVCIRPQSSEPFRRQRGSLAGVGAGGWGLVMVPGGEGMDWACVMLYTRKLYEDIVMCFCQFFMYFLPCGLSRMFS